MMSLCARIFTSAAFLMLVHGKEELPSLRVASDEERANTAVLRDAKWWAHVGDHIYYAPPATSEDLSHHIGDYYCAMGSQDALTDELRNRRVGGHGRWHIFHLPEGTSMLQLGRQGSRRSSFSKLVQLRAGDVMPSTFPIYEASISYRHPLGTEGQMMEKTAASSISGEAVRGYLTAVVDTKGMLGIKTRAFNNPQASKQIQEYLQAQFTSMGLTNCLQTFTYGGMPQANVVAIIPGQTTDTLTVGAHYDSRPFMGQAPGAEDNGSGVAALLAVAKAYAAAGAKPVKTIHFVAFAAEEPGLLGSDFFAKQLKDGASLPSQCLGTGSSGAGSSFLQTQRNLGTAPAKHVAIAMDEVGWLSPKFQNHTVNLESYDWAQGVLEHLADSSRTHNGGALTVVHSSNPFGSDHMSFLDRGMPAVLTINGDDEAYPHYHKSTDSIANVNTEYVAQIARMVLGATVRLSGA